MWQAVIVAQRKESEDIRIQGSSTSCVTRHEHEERAAIEMESRTLASFFLGYLAVLNEELPPFAIVFGKQLYHVHLLSLVLADVLNDFILERAGEAAVLVDLDANLTISCQIENIKREGNGSSPSRTLLHRWPHCPAPSWKPVLPDVCNPHGREIANSGNTLPWWRRSKSLSAESSLFSFPPRAL